MGAISLFYSIWIFKGVERAMIGVVPVWIGGYVVFFMLNVRRSPCGVVFACFSSSCRSKSPFLAPMRLMTDELFKIPIRRESSIDLPSAMQAVKQDPKESPAPSVLAIF